MTVNEIFLKVYGILSVQSNLKEIYTYVPLPHTREIVIFKDLNYIFEIRIYEIFNFPDKFIISFYRNNGEFLDYFRSMVLDIEDDKFIVN